MLLLHRLGSVYEAELDEGWTHSRLEVELILHASVKVGMDRTRLIRASTRAEPPRRRDGASRVGQVADPRDTIRMRAIAGVGPLVLDVILVVRAVKDGPSSLD
jgi:hypothetical protein